MSKYLLTGWEGCIVGAATTEPETLQLIPEVIPALLRFTDAGYEIVPSCNRPDLSESARARKAVVDDSALNILRSQGIHIADLRVCFDAPGDEPSCRRPGVGLFTDLLPTLDRRLSHVVDVDEHTSQFAANLGIDSAQLDPADSRHNWPTVAHQLLDHPRQASVRRKTRETNVAIEVDLDASTDPQASTGLPFFDHMLEQIGKHGGFSLTVNCEGDLEVDEHHTIEDVALALGNALREALGDKRGIERYGFVLPMDETRSEVSIDLGGRPFLVFSAEFPREEVGGMPTELVEHFFRSFSDALGASLHIAVSGENTHHMIEACFKGLARALRAAIRRTGDSLPSTKGVL